MPKVIKPLTATEVKNAKPDQSPLQDGYGLSLIITEHSKRWSFRYSRPIQQWCQNVINSPVGVQFR